MGKLLHGTTINNNSNKHSFQTNCLLNPPPYPRSPQKIDAWFWRKYGQWEEHRNQQCDLHQLVLRLADQQSVKIPNIYEVDNRIKNWKK